MRITLLLVIVFVAGCSSLAPKPVAWTPELVESTQRTFSIAGTWGFTQRSGADFGERCDLVFEADQSYRKSCRPPVEEAGMWQRVGDWDGQTMRILLRDRFDLIDKRNLEDVEVVVVVESPDHDVVTVNGERYERQ